MANVYHHHELNLPDPLRVELKASPKPKSSTIILKVFGRYVADLIKLVIPIFGALYGYNYVNSLTEAREQENRLKTTRINASIQAFDSLITAYILYKKYGTELQSALARIQLFGNSEQIHMISEIENSRTGQSFSVDPIIQSIRNTLRSDLGLDPDTTQIIIAREFPGVTRNSLSPGVWVECETYTGRYYKPNLLKFLDRVVLDQNTVLADIECPLCRKRQGIYKQQLVKIQ